MKWNFDDGQWQPWCPWQDKLSLQKLAGTQIYSYNYCGIAGNAKPVFDPPRRQYRRGFLVAIAVAEHQKHGHGGMWSVRASSHSLRMSA